MQLVQLQQARQRFKDQGIGLAAVSYDTEAILSEFARRQHITFPMLADPKSEIIREYKVLNAGATGMTQGMAFPGFIYIGPDGKVKEKFFEASYTDRYTANNLISKLFPELTEQVATKVEAPHIALTLQQSDVVAVPGSRVTLIAEVELAPEVHVYAPGVKGYKPAEFTLEPSAEFKLNETTYPQAKILLLEAIKEKVPVFEGRFRITQDVTLSADRSFMQSLGKGKTLSIKGELKYQACDLKTCYMPASAHMNWEVQVVPLDFQRSPEGVQHR